MPLDTQIGESGYPLWLEDVRDELHRIIQKPKGRAQFLARSEEGWKRQNSDKTGCIVDRLDGLTLDEQWVLLGVIYDLVTHKLKDTDAELLTSPGPFAAAEKRAWKAYQKQREKAAKAVYSQLAPADCGEAINLAFSKADKAYEDALSRAWRGASQKTRCRAVVFEAVKVSVGDWMMRPPSRRDRRWVCDALAAVMADLGATPPAADGHDDPSPPWSPPPGYVGTKDVCNDASFRKNGKNPPRTTIDTWLNTHPTNKVKAPDTQEVHVPEAWVRERIREWSPRP